MKRLAPAVRCLLEGKRTQTYRAVSRFEDNAGGVDKLNLYPIERLRTETVWPPEIGLLYSNRYCRLSLIGFGFSLLYLIVGGTRLRFDGPGPIISDVGGVE